MDTHLQRSREVIYSLKLCFVLLVLNRYVFGKINLVVEMPSFLDLNVERKLFLY